MAGYAAKCVSKLGFGLLIVLIGFSNSPVAALSDSQRNVLNNDVGYFNVDSCDPSSSTPGSNALNGYQLPANSGKTGVEQPIDAQGYVLDQNGQRNGGQVTFSALLNKVDPSIRQSYQDYYITMRWNYAVWNWDGTSRIVNQVQYQWMAAQPRLVQVTNPATGKSIIAVALESGPAPWTGVQSQPPQPGDTPPLNQGWTNPQLGTPLAYSGRVSGLPPTAFSALGATEGGPNTGTPLNYAWAPDQNAIPGVVQPSSQTPLGAGQACGTGSPTSTGTAVFISQRDPLWTGKIICWDAANGGCDTVYSQGCWATSTAMIISSFTNHAWPNVITPMQTEGNELPQESFDGNNLKDQFRFGGNIDDFRKAVAATQQGALVLIHGSGMSRDGGPFYNSPTHYEVLRGVTASGELLLNDPWDMPLANDSSQPDPKQQNITGKAHTLTPWPEQDVFPYVLDYRVITKGA